jgi:hypothetical protein
MYLIKPKTGSKIIALLAIMTLLISAMPVSQLQAGMAAPSTITVSIQPATPSVATGIHDNLTGIPGPAFRYGLLNDIVLSHVISRISKVTIRRFNDRHTWIRGYIKGLGFILPFDSASKHKPAYGTIYFSLDGDVPGEIPKQGNNCPVIGFC